LGKIDSLGKGDAEIIGVREGLFALCKNLLMMTPHRGHSLNDEFAVKPHFGHLRDVLIPSSGFG
jgi:hypothetical protein